MTKEPDRRDRPTTAVLWGARLKHYREQAGLTQEKFAELINYSAAQVGSLETGRRGPTPTVAQLCDDALDAGGALVRLYQTLIEQAGFRQSFREWVEVEAEATVLRGYESVLIPGLLQTPSYAAVVLKHEKADAVRARLARQDILAKDDPPMVRYVLDEMALRRSVGGADVMREQLEYLEKITGTSHVHVQILRSDAAPDIHGSFVLATSGSGVVGYEEATTRGIVVTDRDDLHWLERAYDYVVAEALPTGDSLGLIRQVKAEVWTG